MSPELGYQDPAILTPRKRSLGQVLKQAQDGLHPSFRAPQGWASITLDRNIHCLISLVLMIFFSLNMHIYLTLSSELGHVLCVWNCVAL